MQPSDPHSASPDLMASSAVAAETSPPALAPVTKAGDAEAIRRILQQRIPADSHLQPVALKSALNRFEIGELDTFARTMDRLLTRHPVIGAVAAKRFKDVARLDWGVYVDDEVPESQRATAEQHKQVLEEFYRHIEASSLLDRDARGGFPRLVRQMALAIGTKWAVHEVVWRPPAGGRPFTAEFILWPLWLFEGRTGSLRWLRGAGIYAGEEMLPGEWLVASSDGLLRATAGLAAIRDMALGDWVAYCEKFGLPFVLGKTPAAKGSAEWAAVAEMVQSFMGDGCGVVNMDAMVELITTGGASGSLPHSGLAEYCDGWIAALWRGGNLGTQSKQDSQGASLQGNETELLLADDATEITGTLNRVIDARVIAYHFGTTAVPLAHVRILPPLRTDTTAELAVDAQLVGMGIKLDRSEMLERYNRSEAETDAEAVMPPAVPVVPPLDAKSQTPDPASATAANEAPPPLDRFAPILADWFAPLRDRLTRITALSESEMVPALEKLQSDLALELRDRGVSPSLAAEIEDALRSEFAAGYAAPPSAD